MGSKSAPSHARRRIKRNQAAPAATERMKAMLERAKIELLTVERGYVCFVSQLLFRKDGSLYSIEAYE
jgi:hypothetical protein